MKAKTIYLLLAALFLTSCANVGVENSSSTIETSIDPYQSAADKVHYDFDPTQVVSREYCIKDGESYRAMNAEEVKEKCKDAPSYDSEYLENDGSYVNIFAKFEGLYVEGYAGDYTCTRGFITLWENGVFSISSISSKKAYSGCWYNDTTKSPDEKNNGNIKFVYCAKNYSGDQLESFVAEKVNESYGDFLLYYPLEYSWGKRTLTMNGYYYYPAVGLWVDDCGKTEFYLSQTTNASEIIDEIRYYWRPYLVLKNLKRVPIITDSIYESTKPVEYSISGCNTTGVKTVVARYDSFYCTKTIELF